MSLASQQREYLMALASQQKGHYFWWLWPLSKRGIIFVGSGLSGKGKKGNSWCIVFRAWLWDTLQNLEDLCVQYDTTVRTSTGEVVQFVYGGDSLDPTAMEGDNKPINFQQLWDHVRVRRGWVVDTDLEDVGVWVCVFLWTVVSVYSVFLL